MKYRLYISIILANCFISIYAPAQESVNCSFFPGSGKGISRAVNKSAAKSCQPDTLLYPYWKEMVFSAPGDSFFTDALAGNVRTAAQAYLLNDAAFIHGVQFWGAAYTTSSVPKSIQARAYLYSVDAQYKPLSVLDSGDVTVTESYGFYTALFNTMHSYNQNFAVAIRCLQNDTLAVLTNNAGASWHTTTYHENLAWRKGGNGTWTNAVSAFGSDNEYMIFPVVSYTINAAFTASDDSICENNDISFTNTSSGILNNRMFNLRAFDFHFGITSGIETFNWDYVNNGGWDMTVDGFYNYSVPGTYNVKLAADMTGYFTSCQDTAVLPVYINHPAIVNATAGICNGSVYYFNSQPISTPGTYMEIFTDVVGCDSTVFLDLQVVNSFNESATVEICDGETYTFGSQILSQTGVYTETFTAVGGCDSTVDLSLGIIIVNNAVSVNDTIATAAAQGAIYQWINCNGNTPVPGANSQTFSTYNAGNYAVIVTENGCSDTSACVNVLALGVNTIIADGVSVYPNPASDHLNIYFSGIAPDQFVLNDALGRTIRVVNNVTKENTIDTGNIPAGLYFLRYYLNGSMQNLRILKQDRQ